MFEWTEEADTALAALKKVLVGPTLLAAPEVKEPMLMYIAVTNRVVNTVMVVKRLEKAESTPSSDPCITLATELKERCPHYQKRVYTFSSAPCTTSCTDTITGSCSSLCSASALLHQVVHHPRLLFSSMQQLLHRHCHRFLHHIKDPSNSIVFESYQGERFWKKSKHPTIMWNR
jgi:hypothetical protein